MGGRIAEELTFGEITTGAAERHRAGHRDGPQDGLRVGHERQPRARSPTARRKRRSSSARSSTATRTTARPPPSRSTPRSSASSPSSTSGRRKLLTEKRPDPGAGGRGPARARGARRPQLRQLIAERAPRRRRPSPWRRLCRAASPARPEGAARSGIPPPVPDTPAHVLRGPRRRGCDLGRGAPPLPRPASGRPGRVRASATLVIGHPRRHARGFVRPGGPAQGGGRPRR